MEKYRTIAKNGEQEIIIKKSRFIGSVARVTTETEAQEFLNTVRQKHAKANHHCFAYQLGFQDEIQRMSDDGEPSGTAGPPILDVLAKEHLNNLICVVTRYFGGIKLGAGGLIRAYSQGTSTAIQSVGLVAGMSQRRYQITIDYNQLDILTHYLAKQAITIANTEYTDVVALTVWLNEDAEETKLTAIKNLLAGQVTFAKQEAGFNEVPIESPK
ncbi:YigZ family protein [Lapidilactobacillus mulanensis]|uniref:YigZ family protein n=1 Tax=Lapidilactobacillus mulanensis TaxID=2485999 RepID=A0ABW4DJN2_9LACO|nr:YigZ family protein [Lapidilactobacillus mulanensis]